MSPLRIVLLAVLGVCLASAGWALLRRPAPSPLPSLRIEVQNGCGVAQLAAQTGRALSALGLDVVRVGDAESHDFAETLLIDRRGKVALTRRLADRIGPVRVVLQREAGSDVDCILVLGADHALMKLLSPAGASLGR